MNNPSPAGVTAFTNLPVVGSVEALAFAALAVVCAVVISPASTDELAFNSPLEVDIAEPLALAADELAAVVAKF